MYEPAIQSTAILAAVVGVCLGLLVGSLAGAALERYKHRRIMERMNHAIYLMRRRTGEEGQATVELAASIVVVLFLLFLLMEGVLALYTYNVLADAAKEGVRYAVVHGSGNCIPSGPQGQLREGCPAGSVMDTSGARVTDRVLLYTGLSLHPVQAGDVRVEWPQGNNDPGSLVNVTIAYRYAPWLFTVLPFNPVLRAGSSGRVMN